jgi:hypothetical protein
MADRRPKNSEFWHQTNRGMCLGCFGCPHLATCGGISIDHHVNDCFDFCACVDGANCPLVCPSNPRHFVARVREVGGFDLDVPQCASVSWPSLPSMVPVLPNGYSRSAALDVPVVGVPLNKLFGAKTGKPIYSTREELCRHFSFSTDAKIVVSGVAYDQLLENYWSVGRGSDLPKCLADMKVDLVTTPNFSLFGNVPRTEDEYNMKRIAICWQELMALGVPTALHLNARTHQDWRRWAQFLKQHPEATGVSFEFGTGAASPKRGGWHRDRLLDLVQGCGRKLHLTLRGGHRHLGALSQSFFIVYLSHSPVIRALRRQRLMWKPGTKEIWQRTPVPNGRDLDHLIAHNILLYGDMILYYLRSGGNRN